MACEKRAFGSRKQAHDAVQTMSQSVRVYWCNECSAYHNSKRGEEGSDRRFASRRKRQVRNNRRSRLDYDN